MSSPEDFAAAPPPGEPSEEELRAAYEAELSRITTTDMIAQATISLLNLGARKLAPAGEGAPEGAGGQDLEQVRDAIDAARALLAILERRIPQELPPLRDALSRLQMAYAQEVQRAPAGEGPPQPGAPAGGGAGGGGSGQDGERGGQGGEGAGRRIGRGRGAGRAAAAGRRAAPARAGRVERAPVGTRQISCRAACGASPGRACGGAAR